ncbi:uncharacterized protein MYCGRDRAFT_105176 [Zymoseptoria tritici IPO323]|uniref:Uncharacterized protein n=1 Tax=Zymoseptoria tritici (strain CBS 115943 / IPO323) TaxID=336722 RepID=F9XFN4_ZYMTI|nr:uncharacterized protein MYCGRDRAFT_105176 [Zymoseptoria tritici IPO323]EGP85657.1 hypothetical protein MYCGRDRAFT_105176 [Zymoseptoria tritici IPO323]
MLVEVGGLEVAVEVFLVGEEDLTLLTLVAFLGEVHRVLANMLSELAATRTKDVSAEIAGLLWKFGDRSLEKGLDICHGLIDVNYVVEAKVEAVKFAARVTAWLIVLVPGIVALVDPVVLRFGRADRLVNIRLVDLRSKR